MHSLTYFLHRSKVAGESSPESLGMPLLVGMCRRKVTLHCFYCMFMISVTVGILVAQHPPYRSVRAELPHTALALSFGESNLRKFMALSEVRNIGFCYGHKTLPSHDSSFLASASQAFQPRSYYKTSISLQCLVIARYSCIVSESLNDTFQPFSCFGDWPMHLLFQFVGDLPDFLS